MNTAFVIQVLASTPLFASRAFQPAFVTAVLARWGGQIPWLGDSEVIRGLSHAPPWFVHDGTIAILGLLAVLEAVAVKNPDVRRGMDYVDRAAKVALYLLTQFALLDAAGLDLAGQIGGGAAGDGAASIDPVGTAAVLVGGASVLGLASARGRLLGALSELDEDDDLGMQALISWIEDWMVLAGTLSVLLLPMLAAVLLLLCVVALVVIERRVRARERELLVPCDPCGQSIHPSAPCCPSCDAAQPSPRRVGVFGGARQQPVRDLHNHRFQLVSRGRCPHCAIRLTRGKLKQTCGGCGRPPFADQAAVTRWLKQVGKRLPLAVGLSFGLGSVPLIGLIPALLAYRLTVIADLRRYLPLSAGVLTRYGLRLMNLGLILLQPIPVLGAFVIPILCVSNFYVYRRVLLAEAQRSLPISPGGTAPGRP